MTDIERFVALNAVGVALVAWLQRRVVFSWTAIGVFVVTNLVIVQIGLLALPFGGRLADQFTFNYSLLDDVDLKWAIVLNVWGGALILFWYHLAHMLFNGGRLLRQAPNLLVLGARSTVPDVHVPRLLAASAGAMLLAVTLLASGAGPLMSGVREGFLEGSAGAVTEARYAVGGDYVLVLTVFNVLPFLGAALWLACRLGGGRVLKLYTAAYCSLTILLLLFTFQKRPLLVFVCALLLVSLGTYEKAVGQKLSRVVFGVARRGARPRGRLILYGMVPLVALMGLYLVQTSIGRMEEDLLAAASNLVERTGVSLIGGLSVPTVLYAHYYPAVEPHYGFRSIGLFSKIFGFELYPATLAVFQYFYIAPEVMLGSISVGAVTDFYGAFGLPGWVGGTFLLGVGFNRIDSWLSRQDASGRRLLLTVFVFVTVYYLSNAPLQNTLLSYGGGIFVALWVFLTIPIRSTRSRPREAAGSEGRA